MFLSILLILLAACGGRQKNTVTDRQGMGMMAPEFTLQSLDGKPVSLKDFRGKYVVLDFWGSWCPWCIKGFPALKAFYAKHKDKVEVIGIDCGDTEDQWRKAVDDHDLPWVNVKNGEAGSDLTSAYGINGFPTKFVISPNGEMITVTVGEDPSFFTKLEEIISKK